MKTWLIGLVRDWIFNKATSGAAAEIRSEDPAMIPALKKYREGAPFMEIIKTYVEATPNKDDDEVVADLMTKPFNEVLPRLAGTIAALHIPDADGDPTNDITVGEALSRVVDKIVNDSEPTPPT